VSLLKYITANKNEQYSRKNIFKVNGVKKTNRENTIEVVKKVLEEEGGVKVNETDVVAIHRIPGKAGEPKPILVEMKNNDAKAKLMKRRSAIKKHSNGRYWLTDDVTKLNAMLIKRLKEHPKITNAWYFNGSVYGEANSLSCWIT
jgi:hypothetical protein